MPAAFLRLRLRRLSPSTAVLAALAIPCLATSATAFGQDASDADAARTIELNNGNQITGVVTENNDDVLVIETDALGTLTIDQADVADDHVDAPPPPTKFDRYFDDLAEKLDAALFTGWDKSFAAGITGSDGNSETLNAYADFATGYEDETDRWDISAAYFRSTSDSEVTANQFDAAILKDWLLPGERHFYWANLRYTYDQLTSYDSRLGGYAGVGYEIWEGPVHTLLGRVGVGGNYEFGDVNEFTPELFLGLDYEWNIDGNQSFTASNYTYPALDPAFGSYRNVATVAYKAKLRAADGLSFKVGARHEYRSEVADDEDSADLKYYAAIAFDF